MMFHLALDFEDAFEVALISHLAEIEDREGYIVVDPNWLYMFFLTVLSGLLAKQKDGEHYYMVGNPDNFSDCEIDEWREVARTAKEISEAIDKCLTT